jgi:hypothetical protein
LNKIDTKKNNGDLILLKYEITYDPLGDKHWRRLPLKIRQRIEELHDNSFHNPEESIPKLKELVNQYPDVPVLYNYLSVAYTNIRDYDNAEKVVLENYRRHPDYLFAKINYAHFCLKKKQFEKVPEIFDDKYELKLLYPKRSKFHISEIISFYGIMSRYFFYIEERKVAKTYYGILKKLDPGHKTTKIVKRLLYPSLLNRFLNKLAKGLDSYIKNYEVNYNKQLNR